MKLFVDCHLDGFEKTAQKELRDPDNWGQEVLDYLLEKTPFVGTYPTKVEWVSKDIENGHAFGYVEVSSNVKKARIPFFVKSNDLFDMDIMVADRKMMPLTEPRLTEALFSPEAFTGTQKRDDIIPPFSAFAGTDQGPLGSLSPPGRRGSFNQSVKLSFLQELQPTMRTNALKKIAEALKDKTLHKLATNNQAVLDALKILAESEDMVKKAMPRNVKTPDPQVIQIITLPNTNQYSVKTASCKAYRVDREILDRASAIAKYGSTSVRAADNSGCITASVYPRVEGQNESKLIPITRAGIYKVMSVEGALLTGMAIPVVYDLDGNSVSTQLFVCGDRYSLQQGLRGERIGDINMGRWEEKTAKGLGTFVWDADADQSFRNNTGWHNWLATVPVTVGKIEVSNSLEEITVTDMLGSKRKIVRSPVKTLISTKETALIPTRAVWVPLGSIIPLVDSAGMEEKIAEAKDFDKSVMIKHVGDRFAFSGHPLRKVAEVDRTRLDRNDATFLGCTLGMNPEFATTKLAQAVKYGKTTVKAATVLIPYENYQREVLEKVASYYDMLETSTADLRSQLLKEAVAVDADEETVDSLLSLNFLTPENIEKFIEYLPQFEKTQQNMCEMLMATRSGQGKVPDLPEGALKSGIKSLEKAMEGLKRMAQTLIASD